MKVTDVAFRKMEVGEDNPTGMLGLATVTFDKKHRFENFKVYTAKGALRIVAPTRTDPRGKRYPLITLTADNEKEIGKNILEVVKAIF